jgi:nucleoside-diphosphate-sugar epimerase
VSGYLGDGASRWPAAHTLDVAHLYRLALEQAPAGSQLYAAAEEGIAVREIAEIIGRHLNGPAVSIPAADATDHFKGFPFIGLDVTMPSADTRQLLGWNPVHPGLIADLEAGQTAGCRLPFAAVACRSRPCPPFAAVARGSWPAAQGV